MIIITCVDNNMGMLFNNRRLSKDKVVTKHIIDLVSNNKIWINNFSKELFEDYKLDNLIIDDDFINKVGNDDYCFIENIFTSELIEKSDKIIVFNWNRKYPANLYFNINLDNWILEKEIDFIGNSHNKITQKIYIRGEK